MTNSSSRSSLGRARWALAAAGAVAVLPAAADLLAGTVDPLTLACALAGPALAGLGLFYLGRAGVTVRHIAGIMRRVAEGDLEARIVRNRDGGELGEIVHALNRMLDITDAFVRESGASMEHVSRSKFFRKILVRGLPGSFRASAEIANAATAAMAGKVEQHRRFACDFEASVGGVIDTVSRAAVELESNARAMSDMAASAMRQSGAAAGATARATASTNEVAASAADLASSVSEIGRQVTQSASIAGRAVAEAERTDMTVRGLSEAAQKIGDVVKLINDIAGQTNLLALNATIEAARAGEAGKGFAVVANEVKSLANQTAKATEDITAQIGAIQASTGQAVAAIGGIRGIITELDDIASAIARAVERQDAVSQDVTRNMDRIAAGTAEVAANISGVSQAAGDTGRAADDVLMASSSLSHQAAALKEHTHTFLSQTRAA
jgi:methyl-accepting chemotaxis protein